MPPSPLSHYLFPLAEPQWGSHRFEPGETERTLSKLLDVCVHMGSRFYSLEGYQYLSDYTWFVEDRAARKKWVDEQAFDSPYIFSKQQRVSMS